MFNPVQERETNIFLKIEKKKIKKLLNLNIAD